jgi:2-(1,2-epoxy-1,2-dihydrophenyl)acetyl-CoA isomerase
MSDAVRYVADDGIAHLVLSRADRGNAISPELIKWLGYCLDRIEQDEGVRALIVSGEGKHFCTGADIAHLLSAGKLDGEISEMARDFHEALLRLYNLPLPVIAAVQGMAVGAGLGLALACDHVICTDAAKFATGYARLGLSPDAGVSFFLTRCLGARRASRMLMSGGVLSAIAARDLGLIDQVCASAELAECAAKTAREYAGFASKGALAAMKRLTRSAESAALAEQLDRERVEITSLAGESAVRETLSRLPQR